jgi:hypothetical protein
VTDLETLYRKLDEATFSQRQQIADEIARDAKGDIASLAKGLAHPHRAVRLGIIEIFRRANHRAGLRELVAHAANHDGDDRVFAIRAIADLAEPSDDFLVETAQTWATSGDPYVEPHGTKLLARLRPSAPAPAASPSPSPVVTLDKLVLELFAAVKGSDRIALVDQIEQRGPAALFAAAKLTFQKGNENLVAYMCRAVIRQAARLPSPEKLIPLLERARMRLRPAGPITETAIEDALVALGGVTLSPALLSRVARMDKAQLESLVMQLIDADASAVALHVPTLLDAIAKMPSLWSTLGPALVHAAPYVRDSTRVELRRHCELVLDDLRAGRLLPPVTVVSMAWVLARVAEPGEHLPQPLRLALDRIAIIEATHALVALCARLATEEAARVLVAMLRDPLPEARIAAREQIDAWHSPWVRIENDRVVPI